MRRKRRNRATWLPVLGHTEVAGEDTAVFADFRIETASLGTTVISTQLTPFPIVPDFTEELGTDANAQLRDAVSGQAWKLARLVGKLHLAVTPQAVTVDPTAQWKYVYVVAGFFVARSVDQAQGSVDLGFDEFDPAGKDNVTNPWIWRRSWMLRNPGLEDNAFDNGTPTTTSGCGSVADGPHIDSRVKRFINREHRLFFTLTARGYSGEEVALGGGATIQPKVTGLLDLRVVGSLARQRNTSSF